MAARGERAKPSQRSRGVTAEIPPTLEGSPVATPLQKSTLTDLGVTKTQSSRWQKLAELDEEAFEARTAVASEWRFFAPY
jgi:hypothetical protein